MVKPSRLPAVTGASHFVWAAWSTGTFPGTGPQGTFWLEWEQFSG